MPPYIPKNDQKLTVKPVHFPKFIVWMAASVWGLSIVSAIVDTVFTKLG